MTDRKPVVEKPNPNRKKNLLEVSMRLEMDLKHKVQDFAEIGMTNPFKYKSSIENAVKEINILDFY